MLDSILVGVVAALIVAAQRAFPQSAVFSPHYVVALAAAAVLLQRLYIEKRPGSRAYDGMAEVFVHIHSPATPDTAGRWTVRGLVSFFLTVIGVGTGPEGAAMEGAHAIEMRSRPRSSRWFEQRRRTDAACALAGAVSAAFGAPFAAVLFPTELGIGGRTMFAVMSSLTAFVCIRLIPGGLGLASGSDGSLIQGAMPFGLSENIPVFDILNGRHWLGFMIVAAAAAVVGVAILKFLRYGRRGFSELFSGKIWLQIFVGGLILAVVLWVRPAAHSPVEFVLTSAVSAHYTLFEAVMVFLGLFVSVAVVVMCFGTAGILWPIVSCGAVLGFCLDRSLLTVGLQAMGPTAVLAGVVAFIGVFFRTPITAAVLILELTQNLPLVVPCLIAAFLARYLGRSFGTHSILDQALQARGLQLVEGRNVSVLEAIYVHDAMVTDFQLVNEKDTLQEVYDRLLGCRYPFLPVVNEAGKYTGLLTVDMVQDGLRAQSETVPHAHAQLASLLEAKDLLYRSGVKVPVIRKDDRLSVTRGIFDLHACVAVIDQDRKVVGLLLGYNVRNAYEREMARRSLAFKAG